MADEKPAAPQPKRRIAAAGILYGLAYDACREQAIAGGSEQTVYSFDLRDEKPAAVERWRGDGYVAALGILDVDAQPAQIVTARYDGSLTWHDLVDGRELRRVPRAHDGWIRDLMVFPGSRHFTTVGHDMLVKVWDAASGDCRRSWAGHAPETPQGYLSALYTVAVAPDGRHVASADRTGEIRVWNFDEDRQVRSFQASEFYTFDPEKRDRSIGGIRRLRFSPDGQWLAASGIGAVTNVDGFVGPNRLEIWDWRSGQRHKLLQDNHQAVLNDVLWSSDSQTLVAAGGGDGGGLFIGWRLNEEKPFFKAKPAGHIQRIAWLDQNHVLGAGFEALEVWHIGAA